MQISVVGANHVGLVVGSCLAERGHRVICIDQNPSIVEALARGRTTIHEFGLSDLVSRNVTSGRLTCTTNLAKGVVGSRAVFIAVGTPPRTDGNADLSQVLGTVAEVASKVIEYTVLIIKSTVPVGTASLLRALVEDSMTGECRCEIVSNPEFLRTGAAIQDFLNPDRLVLGVSSSRALAVTKEIYEPLGIEKGRIIITSHESAEMIKLAANAMLAIRISFINEVARFCAAVRADIDDVVLGVGLDRRIGTDHLNPGPGFGGGCLPKDLMSVVMQSREHNSSFALAETALSVNALQLHDIITCIQRIVGSMEGKTVAIFGLSFKPDTDDIRESQAVKVAAYLQTQKAVVHAYDPIVTTTSGAPLSGIRYFTNPYDASEGADIVVVMVAWPEFEAVDYNALSKNVRHRVVYDVVNMLDRDHLEDLGFQYVCTGYRSKRPERIDLAAFDKFSALI